MEEGERNRKIGGDTEGGSAKKRSFLYLSRWCNFLTFPRSGRRRQKCKHRAKERIPGKQKKGRPRNGEGVLFVREGVGEILFGDSQETVWGGESVVTQFRFAKVEETRKGNFMKHFSFYLLRSRWS